MRMLPIAVACTLLSTVGAVGVSADQSCLTYLGVCSNDPSAKQTVMELIEQTGFRPVDCGGLENARTLDLMVPLMLELDNRYGADATSSWKFFNAG